MTQQEILRLIKKGINRGSLEVKCPYCSSNQTSLCSICNSKGFVSIKALLYIVSFYIKPVLSVYKQNFYLSKIKTLVYGPPKLYLPNLHLHDLYQVKTANAIGNQILKNALKTLK